MPWPTRMQMVERGKNGGEWEGRGKKKRIPHPQEARVRDDNCGEEATRWRGGAAARTESPVKT
jgi:hypothetical protein